MILEAMKVVTDIITESLIGRPVILEAMKVVTDIITVSLIGSTCDTRSYEGRDRHYYRESNRMIL